MKRASTLLIILTQLVVSGFAQAKPGNKAVLDSLEVLKKMGAFADGYGNPPTGEEMRYHNIVQLLLKLPFYEVKKLMQDKNTIARAYGFAIAAKMHFDSLTKEDLKIFNDTSRVLFYTPQEIKDLGFTVGKLTEMMYNSAIEERNSGEPDVINAVKAFIKTNAAFPDSYEPGDFPHFGTGTVDDLVSYDIRHRYKIKQRDGTVVETAHYFILDKKFNIMLIETVRSQIFSVPSPRISEWMEKYGKKE